MRVRATCRLQLHPEFGFAAAEARLPYLQSLGISHLYLSPIGTAQPGSMHGYDVIDPTRINPELGGEPGFRSLAAAARARGMGVLLDIVPNHMSVTGGANPWWNDVLEKGRESPFARFFDIDWGRPILLPFLGEPLEEAIAGGALRVVREGGKAWILAYGRDRYPLRAEPGEADETLGALLGRQHWRLASWRAANDELNWRRFFTITGLAGLRQEDEAVFEATHALWFRLYSEGLIDGLRIDHVDGLADPAGYARRLRARLKRIAPEREPWLIVEKILGPAEALAGDWGIDGTTGYDFMEQASALLHDPAGEAALTAHWAKLSGRPGDFAAEEIAARRELLESDFGGQLGACAAAFAALARSDPEMEAPTEGVLRRAIGALLCVFPAYRVYGSPADAPILERARARAGPLVPPGEAAIVDRIVDWISGGAGSPLKAEAARRFAQLSSPIAAKAVEDTAFYRYGRLLSRNDVGFDPGRFSLEVGGFHEAMARRAAEWPRSMLATATHDHKKGEDVRARLAVLSEVPWRWVETSDRLRDLAAGAGIGVEPADRYMLHQMLVGAWPAALALEDQEGLVRYRDRLWAWFEKALREARLRSSWTEPDEAYEQRCRDLVWRLFETTGFLETAAGFADWIAPAGEANSLVQLFLRCTAPGIPDCYQGCEYADLSLVDPDNRRAVDFEARAATLTAPDSGFDSVKQHLMADLLRRRCERPGLWEEGDWRPVAAEGPRADRLIAFERRSGGGALLGVAAIRCGEELAASKRRTPRPDFWQGTRLLIEGEPLVADLLDALPVHLSTG